MMRGFSSRTTQIIRVANDEAQRLGQHDIEPQHLLLGLLQPAGDITVRALQASGANIAELTRLSREAMARETQSCLSTADPRRNQMMTRILTLAMEEAAKEGELVEPQHLLGGLLNGGEGPVVDALRHSGVTVARFQAELQALKQSVDQDTVTSQCDSGVILASLGDRGELVWKRQAQRLVERAVTEALKSGAREVRSEHFLFVMLDESAEDTCGRALAGLGITREKIERALAKEIGSSHE